MHELLIIHYTAGITIYLHQAFQDQVIAHKMPEGSSYQSLHLPTISPCHSHVDTIVFKIWLSMIWSISATS